MSKWHEGDLGLLVGFAAIVLAIGISIALCFWAGCDRPALPVAKTAPEGP